MQISFTVKKLLNFEFRQSDMFPLETHERKLAEICFFWSIFFYFLTFYMSFNKIRWRWWWECCFSQNVSFSKLWKCRILSTKMITGNWNLGLIDHYIGSRIDKNRFLNYSFFHMCPTFGTKQQNILKVETKSTILKKSIILFLTFLDVI